MKYTGKNATGSQNRQNMASEVSDTAEWESKCQKMGDHSDTNNQQYTAITASKLFLWGNLDWNYIGRNVTCRTKWVN